MQIQHEDEVEEGDRGGGEDSIPGISSPTDENGDEAQSRQTAEDEPKEIKEQVGVVSVDHRWQQQDQAVREPTKW